MMNGLIKNHCLETQDLLEVLKNIRKTVESQTIDLKKEVKMIKRELYKNTYIKVRNKLISFAYPYNQPESVQVQVEV